MFSDLFIKSISISDQLPANSYLNDLAVIKSLQAMGRLNFTKQFLNAPEQMCKYLFSDD